MRLWYPGVEKRRTWTDKGSDGNSLFTHVATMLIYNVRVYNNI